MSRTLREDARLIWQAGVDAVSSETLVRDAVRRTGDALIVAGEQIPLDRLGRIAVVGAGKAGAGMAAGIEAALGSELLERTSGWVNVPGNCVRELERIHLHAARPVGVNEPTEAGVEGSRRILELVGELGADDLCLVLISGGGSALLPAPVPEISLADKQQVTRLLMHSGATINELNCVRKQLSAVKGGGLARATRAGRVVALIISDVIGDPLDTIASGPTVADSSTPGDALAVLVKCVHDPDDVPEAVWDYLKSVAAAPAAPPVADHVANIVVGSNAVALDASRRKAVELGYAVQSLGSENEGIAREVGVELAEMCRQVRDRSVPVSPPACILSGGEPIVQLVTTDKPRKGGRNQELVLAGLAHLADDGLDRIVLLSGGTDGEDGPTNAAGAVAEAELLGAVREAELEFEEFLSINNSYPFFEATGGLLLTGPTHTNVMDLRVGLVGG
ncbi:MAG: glycerate kinase [Planctomycetaceae bacterium]|nr:glycerate kinase [Planctomycetaceae bacterium]